MFGKSDHADDLEADCAYARDRLLGAMARTLEVLLTQHTSDIVLCDAESARRLHKATLLLGGLSQCIEHFGDAEQRLRSHRHG